MIEPSRIFPKDDRELRRLIRAREDYVKQMTQEKNKIHQSLDSACIKLASVISDIFGKSGMYLLSCVLEGKDIAEMIEGIPSGRLKKKADHIKEAIKSRLEISQVILIRGSLRQGSWKAQASAWQAPHAFWRWRCARRASLHLMVQGSHAQALDQSHLGVELALERTLEADDLYEMRPGELCRQCLDYH